MEFSLFDEYNYCMLHRDKDGAVESVSYAMQIVLPPRDGAMPEPHMRDDGAASAGYRKGIGFLHRGLEVGCAVAIVIVLLPLMALLCVTVYLSDPGPIFFAHRRVGRGGRMFKCWKFRTMVQDADAKLIAHLRDNPAAVAEWNRDHKLRDDPRVTLVGSFLRRSSLDELPQLFNVILGTMSLVGPRPIVPDECRRYGRYMRHYALVRPGITGLWQISGRNNISYRRRVAYDVIYCRRRSILLDARIIALTLPSVAMQHGAY